MWKSKKQRAKGKEQGAKGKEHRAKSEELEARSKEQEEEPYAPSSKPSALSPVLDVFKITEEPLNAGTMPALPEEPVNGGDHDDTVEKLESLRAEILKLGKAQIQTRMFAESEYRALREVMDALSADNDHVAEMVIEDLLSIADGLEAGIRAGETISSATDINVCPPMEPWLDGVRIIHQRVMELLGKFDVYPLHSVGKPFDPSLHVAVAVEHMQEVDDDIVLEEQRRGYARGDKMIRYAEVVVNKQPREQPPIPLC